MDNAKKYGYSPFDDEWQMAEKRERWKNERIAELEAELAHEKDVQCSSDHVESMCKQIERLRAALRDIESYDGNAPHPIAVARKARRENEG